MEHRTTLIRPGITRSEMEEIIRAYYANRKTQALEEQKVPAVVPAGTAPLVDPHALAVGGRFQGNSRGRRFGGSSRLNSSCLSSSSGSFVVPDSSSLSSSSGNLVVLDSISLGSISGSTVVPGSSSSAGAEVSTTSNLPGSSSSNMRGMVGLGILDEDGIS